VLAGLVSSQTLFEESTTLQDAVATADFDRELQMISDEDDDILDDLDNDLDGLDELDEIDDDNESPEEDESESDSRANRWQKKRDWGRKQWGKKRNQWGKKVDRWGKNKWGNDRWNKKKNYWGKKKDKWGKKRNQWGKKKWGKKRNNWGKRKRWEKPDKETMQKMKQMGAMMKELGPCAPVVKKTMMDCFFVTANGVKRITDDVELGIRGLTPEANKRIGAETGRCYETGLNKMAECLKKNALEGNEKKESNSDSDLDLPDSKEDFSDDTMQALTDDLLDGVN